MTAKAKLKCPDCSATFNDPRGLGLHRSNVHGIKGQSKGAIEARAKKASAAAGITINKTPPSGIVESLRGKYPCQVCDFVGKWKGGLTLHMLRSHKIKKGEPLPPRQPSPTPTAYPGSASRKLAGKFPCPHCYFIAKWKGGLAHHITMKHKAVTEPTRRELAEITQDAEVVHASNGHAHPQAQDDGSHRLEAAATYAAGRVAQLLESIAIQYELPARSFTALVLRTVGQTTQVR